MREELYQVGRIIRPHGIRGEVSVESTLGEPERFLGLERVFLRRGVEGKVRSWDIEGVRIHKGRALIKFPAIEDMNAAEELRGLEVCLPKANLVELGEEEYFWFDLQGLTVVLTDGAEFGVVDSVSDVAGNAMLVLRDQETGKLHEVPFVKAFFPEVDLKARRVVFTPLPGILGINEN